MKKLLIYIFFAGTLFSSCKSYYTVNKTENQYLKIDKKLDSIKDQKIESIIAPYKTKLDKKMNQIIGYADYLNKARPESTLGNWMADAIAQKASELSGEKIDFAVQNYGGLRLAEIPAGPVTLGKMYELMPFQNFLTILTVKGNILKQFFDRMADYGGWPISKSVKYQISGNKAKNIYINGKPLDLNATYTIALSDYIANGGDRCFFLKNQKKYLTDILIRDILIEKVKEENAKGHHISSKIDGRVINNGK